MISWNIREGRIFLALVALAIFLRWLFFTGYFGSDEVTYTGVALDISNGVWLTSNYIGSIRYGINMPAAFFMALFGPSEFSANLWSFLCSIGEIVVVYLFARQVWGARAAWLAALLLVFLPLHVHYAGRLMADSPLAFFITLSFYFFWLAERQQRHLWYLLAGVSAGLVFWVKESVFPVYILVFFLYAIVFWRWNWRWLFFAGTALVTLAANSLLMAWITGDPLHVLHVMQKGMQNPNLSPTRGHTPDYYFKYLFLDVRHTWLLAYIALAGIVLTMKSRRKEGWSDSTYISLWAVGLVLVFSFMVVSGKSMRFIPKQTNYMLIFVAPLAMLGGYYLSTLGKKVSWAIVAAYMVGGVALSAMEQQAIHGFTANSKAAYKFAQDNRDAVIYGSTNAVRAVHYRRLFADDPDVIRNIYPLIKLAGNQMRCEMSDSISNQCLAYAVVDHKTLGWGNAEVGNPLKIPLCWQRKEDLQPIGFGSGKVLTDLMRDFASAIPGGIGEKISGQLENTFVPQPAYIYRIPCALPPGMNTLPPDT